MEKTESKNFKKMIYVGIGSNLKSKKYKNSCDVCLDAINHLEKFFKVLKISSFYESEPVPKSDQPLFVNAVFAIYTKKHEREILEILNQIEKDFGRERSVKNESRILDLDIIDYNGKIVNNKELRIPHPRLHLRKFVLLPLYEIEPNWVHPVFNEKIPNLLRKITDIQKIKKI